MDDGSGPAEPAGDLDRDSADRTEVLARGSDSGCVTRLPPLPVLLFLAGGRKKLRFCQSPDLGANAAQYKPDRFGSDGFW